MPAVLAPPAAAGAEERAGAGGPADRGCLLWHHPGETGPEESAGGGGLQRGSWPWPQRAPEHNQHAAGVVSVFAMASVRTLQIYVSITRVFPTHGPPLSLSGVRGVRPSCVVSRSRSRGPTNIERASSRSKSKWKQRLVHPISPPALHPPQKIH